MNIYEFNVTCKCPRDGHRDWYRARIEAPVMILAEHIEAAVESLVNAKAYQENAAQLLSTSLCAKVTLRGMHYGIEVTA